VESTNHGTVYCMNINESAFNVQKKISLAAYKMIRLKFELACKSSSVYGENNEICQKNLLQPANYSATFLKVMIIFLIEFLIRYDTIEEFNVDSKAEYTA